MRKAFIGRGGFKLSDSGGRTVIDKMYDLEDNGDPEFSGTDRPEWYDGMVCVEAERENHFVNSSDMMDLGSGGNEVTTSAIEILGFNGIQITNNEGSTGAVNAAATRVNVYLSGATGDTGDRFTFSTYLKRTNGSEAQIRCGSGVTDAVVIDIDAGTVTPGSFTGDIDYVTGFVKQVNADLYYAEWVIGITADSTSITRGDLAVQDEGGSMGFAAYQVEAGSYATLRIPTSGSPVTRLAPTVAIEDALPVTGTVAGVVDMVRDESIIQWFFDSTGSMSSSLNRSRFYVTTGGNFQISIFGSSGGTINSAIPFPWENNHRTSFSWYASWNESTLEAVFLHGSNIYVLSTAHDINDSEYRDIVIGSDSNNDRHTSYRFEKPWHKDEIDRTGATDDEIKEFFELLTLGTSMQMTADEMEIVS